MPSSSRLPARRARLIVVVAAVATSVAATAPEADRADVVPHRHAGEVAGGHVGAVDDATPLLLWHTPHLACDAPPPVTAPSAPPGCDGTPLTWTVTVAGGADALRVDFDQPYRQDGFQLTVAGPGGTRSIRSHGSLSDGVTFDRPATGTWTVTLTPERTAGTTVRLRAGLVPPAAGTPGELLPNLRVIPPFEFGFVAPANPTNSIFFASDDENPGIEVAGQRPVSCTPDEVQEVADPTRNDQPTLLTRCLRFTAGPENAGPGHLDLRFPFLFRAQHDRDRLLEMTQFIHDRDGPVRQRPAGTFEYHATHGHYHYADILFYEILALRAPAADGLEPVGVGHKSGFCPADQGYAEWLALDQPPAGAVHRFQPGDCLGTGGRGAMGLSAGWGDVYRWQRPGQFVDVSGLGDGEYVVRATVDILDNVLETDETDNAAYAWIRITGDRVEVLERGRGASPWDPTKVPAADFRH